MVSCILSRLVVLLFGTLYPAYASYKAIKTKDLREYVKWMMYWIVFALFTFMETFADLFLSFWVPFYYELKIIFVVWLLSPATRGSSILYRKFVHPELSKHENDIDEFIERAKLHGYTTVKELGQKGITYAATLVMQTAVKGQAMLVTQLQKSYSLNDLSRVDGDDRGFPRLPPPQTVSEDSMYSSGEDENIGEPMPLRYKRNAKALVVKRRSPRSPTRRASADLDHLDSSSTIPRRSKSKRKAVSKRANTSPIRKTSET